MERWGRALARCGSSAPTSMPCLCCSTVILSFRMTQFNRMKKKIQSLTVAMSHRRITEKIPGQQPLDYCESLREIKIKCNCKVLFRLPEAALSLLLKAEKLIFCSIMQPVIADSTIDQNRIL